MTIIELYKGGKWRREIDFPTTWDELTAGELERIGRALRNGDLRQVLLCDLIEMRAKGQGKRMPKGWRVLLDPEQATIDGLPLIAGLLEDNNRVTNPYPMLAGCYGPTDDFNDLLTGEFEDCEVFISEFNASNDPIHLAKLAAALWRPLDNKRQRVAYEAHKPDARSFLRRAGEDKLHSIYLWFAGCRSRLPLLFPDVFAGGEGSGPEEQDITGFTRLIHHAAGPKNGTRRQVRATLIKELLFDCQLAIEEAREIERRSKEQQ